MASSGPAAAHKDVDYTRFYPLFYCDLSVAAFALYMCCLFLWRDVTSAEISDPNRRVQVFFLSFFLDL